MKDGKIGVAVVGAGAVAPAHVRACLELADICEVRAVCNSTLSKAEKLISEYGLNAAAVGDWREILSMPDVDAVFVCLPPALHAEVSAAALRAGKHVLCEKPMAGSLEECDDMLRAAEESGCLLGVVAQNRYRTPYWKLKTLIDEKAMGELRFATVNSLWWRGENYYDIWWRGTWEKENGGCLLSHAVHHIDLLQWMFGMPDSVQGVLANVGHHNSECEDFASAVLKYPGAVVQLTASLVTHNEAQEIIVQGEKAGMSVPWGVWSSKALPNGFPEGDAETAAEIQRRYDNISAPARDGHTAQIENFLRAVRGEEELLIDGRQGRNTIEIITAIYKASCTGATVTLPIKEDDVFYRKGGTAKMMPHFFEKTKSIDKAPDAPPISFGRDVGK